MNEEQRAAWAKLYSQLETLAGELIELTDGDLGLARTMWGAAFEEGERRDHNNQMADSAAAEDAGERAVREQAERFDAAEQRRAGFRDVAGAESTPEPDDAEARLNRRARLALQALEELGIQIPEID
jgi:hypothetical protein